MPPLRTSHLETIKRDGGKKKKKEKKVGQAGRFRLRRCRNMSEHDKRHRPEARQRENGKWSKT